MDALTWVSILRLLHIVAGVLWVGAAALITLYLLPSVFAAGPSGGEVMRQITQVRRLPRFMETVTLVTVLSGFVLYWKVSGGMAVGWLTSVPGLTLGLGGVLAIAAAVLGITVNAPTAKQLGALAASLGAGGGPPAPDLLGEMKRLQVRILRGSQVGTVLLLAATAAMAIARYLW